MLAVDSYSISLLQSDTDSISSLVSLDLAGLPTALKHLEGSAWALADSMAGLYVISLAQQCSLQKLTAEVPLSVANILCCVPNLHAAEGDAHFLSWVRRLHICASPVSGASSLHDDTHQADAKSSAINDGHDSVSQHAYQ